MKLEMCLGEFTILIHTVPANIGALHGSVDNLVSDAVSVLL